MQLQLQPLHTSRVAIWNMQLHCSMACHAADRRLPDAHDVQYISVAGARQSLMAATKLQSPELVAATETILQAAAKLLSPLRGPYKKGVKATRPYQSKAGT
jgi:hypothetical protein